MDNKDKMEYKIGRGEFVQSYGFPGEVDCLIELQNNREVGRIPLSELDTARLGGRHVEKPLSVEQGKAVLVNPIFKRALLSEMQDPARCFPMSLLRKLPPELQTAQVAMKVMEARTQNHVKAGGKGEDPMVKDFYGNRDFWTGYKAFGDMHELMNMSKKYGMKLSNDEGYIATANLDGLDGHKKKAIYMAAMRYLAGQEEITKQQEKKSGIADI